MKKVNLVPIAIAMILVLMFFGACKQEHRKAVDSTIDFEFIKLGIPDSIYFDSNGVIGAGVFIKNIHEDSLYVKIKMIDPISGEPDTISKSHVIYFSPNHKRMFNDAINCFESLNIPDGEISGTDPGEGAIYCGGSYIMNYINASKIKRQFSFRSHDLESAIDSLVTLQYDLVKQLRTQRSNTIMFFNTDSIVRYYFKLHPLKRHAPPLPPLRSTIKFVPPEIKPDERPE